MSGLFTLPALLLLASPGAGAAPPPAGAKSVVTKSLQDLSTRPLALLSRRGVNVRGDQRLDIDAAALDLLRGSSGPVVIDLPIDDVASIALHLDRFNVVAPDGQFDVMRAGKAMQVQPPDVLLFRGTVAGEGHSHVFLALRQLAGADAAITGGGSVSLADGRSFQLASDVVDGKASGLVVRSGQPVLPEFDEFCVVIDEGHSIDDGGIAGSPGVDPARGPRVVTVAIDSDASYSDLFNDDEDAALGYIVQLAGAVSDIYLRDLNMSLSLAFSRIWPDGGEPFSADDLSGFRNYWQANEDTTGLNLVHMLSGRRNLSYGGIAYLADACNGDAYAISGFLLGGFPSPVEQPDLGNWDVIVVAHEMGHNLGTGHTHSYDPPVDTCASGTNERGTIMSYCHIRPGGLLNIDPRMHAVTQQIINADNPAGLCLFHDCNGNGISDTLDIAIDASFDVDANGVPDECDDCNANGVLDSLDILAGELDVNFNSIPDSCEDDCNSNATPDHWEIAQQFAADLNGNNVPDECEPDCDANGIADFWDIHTATHTDLDRDSVPDVCQDCNGNGQPDWIDVDRQFNVFIGLAGGLVREYHAASGVFVQEHGGGLVQGAYDLEFGPDGALYVASFVTSSIVRIDVDSGRSSIFVDSIAGQLHAPSALTFGPDGNLYVARQSDDSVAKYNGQTGEFLGVFVRPGSGGLFSPWDLVFGPGGHLFVVCENNRVLRFSGINGDFGGVFIDEGLFAPRAMLYRPDGVVLVTNATGGLVTMYDNIGQPLGAFNDEYPVVQPWGITLGPNGNVYFARNDISRIIEYDDVTGIYQRSFIRGDELLVNTAPIVFRGASANDLDGDGLPDDCGTQPCAADLQPPKGGDGVVDAADLGALLAAWNTNPAGPPDFDSSGSVGPEDLATLLASWGACP